MSQNSISTIEAIRRLIEAQKQWSYFRPGQGVDSFEQGSSAQATNLGSVAFGRNTQAIGDYALAGGINTTANSRDSFAYGFGNIAGGKGFRIIGQEAGEEGTGYYSLNTVEGIQVNQNYIVRLSGVSETLEGKILAINDNKVHIDCYRTDFTLEDLNDGYNMEELQNFEVPATDCNYLCIIGHPELGDISIGFNAIAFGENNIASERSSVAFGRGNKAIGQYSFATGRGNIVNFGSSASGLLNVVSGVTSHAEGNHNIASGNSTHAEGFYTVASAPYAHAEGEGSVDKPLEASGRGAHAEGCKTKASNLYAHAEGRETTASGDSSHAEGQYSRATNTAAHAEGLNTFASGYGSHTEGEKTRATNFYAHAEGRGDDTTGATGDSSHSEGQYTLASKPGSHSEGIRTQAINNAAHAEGKGTVAFGLYSHAEGDVDNWSIIQINGKDMEADAHGHYSHREGRNTTAYNNGAHAEGEGSIAYGYQSHAEGKNTRAIGSQAHAEGQETQALANQSHAGGLGTKATTVAQTAIGKYNKEDNTALFVVGAGTGNADANRANAFTAGNDGTNDYITIGEEKLTEPELKNIKTGIDTIGDIETALDAILAIQIELISPKFGLDINGTVHYFAFGEGMTWGEFIDSDYNNGDFKRRPHGLNPTSNIWVCYQSEDNIIYDSWGETQTDWEISTEYNYTINW